MKDTQITKECHRCGFTLAFFSKTWEQMEWANGKRFPTKHKGCGGEFLSRVGEIGRAS